MTKPSMHWIGDKVDRLGRRWSNVSTNKGGPGSGPEGDTMWVKITNKYHEPYPPPPIPGDSKSVRALREKERP